MGLYCSLVRLAAERAEEATRRKTESDMVEAIQSAASRAMSLDKAWHGIHVLLNPGFPDASWPNAFLLSGGRLLSDRDWSEAYGVRVPDLRVLSVEESAEAAEALQEVTSRRALLRYDPDLMTRHKIYPGIWERRRPFIPWLLAKYARASEPGQYLVSYFATLRAFMAEAAAARESTVIKYHQ